MMFKREVSCKDVVIGTEWENPIRVRNVTGAEAKLAARLTALTKNTILKGRARAPVFAGCTIEQCTPKAHIC